MACINPDGSLTIAGKRILEATQTPISTNEIQDKTSLPLFRIRAALREMLETGYVTVDNEKYNITPKGRKQLE